MRGLKDKRVIITGGASGIGRATAARFYEEGSYIVIVDMPPLDKTELAHQFPERMTYVQADIASKAGLDAIQVEMDKGVDVLINNAGITRDATIAKMEQSAWDQVIAVNLTAVFNLSQMAMRLMKEQKSGVILNAASVVAHYGNFGQANYVATKAGVLGLTKTLSKELSRYGIRVNAVAPGFIETPMVDKIPEKVINMMKEKIPQGRLGKPEEIAATYAFLASDDGAYITGTTIDVDGGLVIG